MSSRPLSVGAATGALALLAACTPFTKVTGEGSTVDKMKGDWVVMWAGGKKLEQPGLRPELNFDPSRNAVSGFDGCNRFTGTYAFEGGRLKARTAGTRAACPNDAARLVSTQMADLLANGAEVVEVSMMQGHVLMLRNAQSELRLGPAAAVK